MKTKQVSIDISLNYLREEQNRGNYVIDWIQDYCKKNKIKIEVIDVGSFRNFGETDTYWRLIFKSNNQLSWFTRKGNQLYPYFEFL